MGNAKIQLMKETVSCDSLIYGPIRSMLFLRYNRYILLE